MKNRYENRVITEIKGTKIYSDILKLADRKFIFTHELIAKIGYSEVSSYISYNNEYRISYIQKNSEIELKIRITINYGRITKILYYNSLIENRYREIDKDAVVPLIMILTENSIFRTGIDFGIIGLTA